MAESAACDDERMPSLWEFHLQIEEPSRVSREDLHWLLSAWLDAPAGRSCKVRPKHEANDKPYALGQFAVVGDLLQVQVGVLTDGLPGDDGAELTVNMAGFLVRGVLDSFQGRMSLGSGRGRRPFTAVSVSDGAQNAPLRLLAEERWEVLAGADPVDRWRMDFLSPTFFTSNNVTVPYPLPSLVLGSLERKWLRWAPAALRGLGIAVTDDPRVGIHTEDFRLHPARGVLSRGREGLGFTGSIQHALRPRIGGVAVPEDFSAAAGRLLALARYSGIGYETTRGYGVARSTPVGK